MCKMKRKKIVLRPDFSVPFSTLPRSVMISVQLTKRRNCALILDLYNAVSRLWEGELYIIPGLFTYLSSTALFTNFAGSRPKPKSLR